MTDFQFDENGKLIINQAIENDLELIKNAKEKGLSITQYKKSIRKTQTDKNNEGSANEI